MAAELRKAFHHDLDEIRQMIIRLAQMVSESIPRATQVLLANDLAGAQALIDGDDDLDVLAFAIEERCDTVLSLQQPMAGDLRSIMCAIHLIAEIERSGDLVVNIAKATRRLYGADIDPKLRGLIERMSEEAHRLFRLAIDAYKDADAGLAAALDDIDDRLDELHTDYIQAIFESQVPETADLQAAVQLALIGRYYERIGDHGVNIGERVRYMVTGWRPEHSGVARIAARQEANESVAGERSDTVADG